MLTLNDGRTELWQWDTGRTMAVDADCSQVHFSNKVFGRSIDVDVVDGVSVIPDILLQTDKDLNVWAFVGTAENGYTKISKTFKVNRRNKPADYVFTPPEQTTLAELSGRIDRIEESQDPDAIKNAVDDYLKQNPVEAPVQSVNGQTGTVALTAEDVGAISVETDPTVPGWAKAAQKPSYTADEVGALSAKTLPEAINTALAQAKASGEFDGADGQNGAPGQDGITPTIGENGNWYLGDTDTGKPSRGEAGKAGADGRDGADGATGADGKSAYQYAVEGGYTGTEAEFAAKLAQEKFANPNALTFSGAATGSYDGSEPLTVEIPSGGGEDELPIIQEYTIEGDETAKIVFTGLPNISEFLLEIAWKWQSTSVSGTVRVSFSETTSGYNHRVGRISSVSTGSTEKIIIRGRPTTKNGNIVVLSALATGSRDANESLSVSELTSTSVISVWWNDSGKYFPAGTTVSLRGK